MGRNEKLFITLLMAVILFVLTPLALFSGKDHQRTLDAVHASGFEAGQSGASTLSCPYEEGSYLYRAWKQGWIDGFIAKQQKEQAK